MKSTNFTSVKLAKSVVKNNMRHYNDMMEKKKMSESKLIMASGNLIDMAESGEFDIIVHGCNCFCTMGGGIAKQISTRYPEAKHADNKTIRGDYNKLGFYTKTESIKNFTIINAYTQFSMSTGNDVFEYAAFELILQKLAYEYDDKLFGFPMIGMGLAGGDKARIMGLLRNFADEIASTGGSATLVEYAP